MTNHSAPQTGRTIGMLLDGDQAGLTRQADHLSDVIHNRATCPECDHRGPHQDNGASDPDEFELCCEGCGYVFQPGPEEWGCEDAGCPDAEDR